MTVLEQVVSASQRLRPRTKVIYLGAVRSFVAFASENPRNWTPETIEAWQRARLRGGAKPQTVNLELAGLKYAAKRVADRARDPYQNFAAPVEPLQVGERAQRKALNVDQVRRLLATCAHNRPIDLRDRAIIVLGVRTGIRRQGMVGIKLSDYDGARLRVVLKGGKSHVVALDGETRAALDAWLDWLASQSIRTGCVFRPLKRERVDGSYYIGGCLSPNALFAMLKKRAKDAGVRGVSPHVLRHTFVSWAVEAGVPVHRIKEVTGHKSDSMVNLYTHDTRADEPVGAELPELFPRGPR